MIQEEENESSVLYPKQQVVTNDPEFVVNYVNQDAQEVRRKLVLEGLNHNNEPKKDEINQNTRFIDIDGTFYISKNLYKIVGNDNLKEYDTSRNDIERAVRLNEIELEESETDSELSSSEQETETVHGKF